MIISCVHQVPPCDSRQVAPVNRNLKADSAVEIPTETEGLTGPVAYAVNSFVTLRCLKPMIQLSSVGVASQAFRLLQQSQMEWFLIKVYLLLTILNAQKYNASMIISWLGFSAELQMTDFSLPPQWLEGQHPGSWSCVSKVRTLLLMVLP